MNEYPETYNPHTYYISETQPVHLKLRGNYLKVSHTRSPVPRISVWNEPELHVRLTHHRIYNLLGASITILPEGLCRTKYVLFKFWNRTFCISENFRRWSRKYPICISLPSIEHIVAIRQVADGHVDSVNSSTGSRNVPVNITK